VGLEISMTPARLSIETTTSQLSIETRKARLELTRPEVKINVHTELPRVIIDQYECFATSGLMGPIDMTRYYGQQAMQQAITYASKVSGDGDSMAAIENPSDPMPDIVERDAFPEHEFVLDYMPKARPKITVTGGVQIDVERSGNAGNRVYGTYTPGSINIDYTPARVMIHMAQYPSVSMKYIPSRFDRFI